MQIRIKISKFNPRKIQNFFMSQNLLYEIKYMFFNQMYHKPFLPKVPFCPPPPPPLKTPENQKAICFQEVLQGNVGRKWITKNLLKI